MIVSLAVKIIICFCKFIYKNILDFDDFVCKKRFYMRLNLNAKINKVGDLLLNLYYFELNNL